MNDLEINETPMNFGKPAPQVTVTPDAVVTPTPEVANTETPTTPVTTITPPATPTPSPWEFKVDEFNKKFNTKFKDDNEFTSSLKSLDEVTTLKERAKELDSTTKKYNDLLAEFDIDKYFVSKEERVRQELLKTHPNEDPTILTRIAKTDLKLANDLDVLALSELRKTPTLTDNQARQLALRCLGVKSETDFNALKESDPEEFDMVNLLAKSKASEVRKELSAFTNFQVTPSTFEAERQARIQAEEQRVANLTEATKPLVEEVMNSLKDLKLFKSTEKGDTEEALTYNLEDMNSREVKKAVAEQWIEQGWGADKDGFEKARAFANAVSILNNLPDILSRYEKNIIAAQKNATHDLIHNDKPINTTTAPEVKTGPDPLGNFLTMPDVKPGGISL